MSFTSGQEIIGLLIKSGLRPTKQRQALASLLFTGEDRHITAEDLFAESQNAQLHVSLATVYNALRQFTEVGLMREIHIDGSRVYYDTCTEDHPHFYWEDTQTLEDAPAGSVIFSQLPEPPEGGHIEKVDVVLRLSRTPSAGVPET